MPPLLREEREGIVVLTLNRPEVRNAISRALAEEIEATIRGLSTRREIRVVIFQGAGDAAFSAGTDLKERRRPLGGREVGAECFVAPRQ